MAVPIFILGAAGIAALAGLGSGASAINKNESAKDITMVAQATYDHAKEKADKTRKKSNMCLEELGRARSEVLQSINQFIDISEKIEYIKWDRPTGIAELDKYKFNRESVLQMRELNAIATSIAKGLAGGIGTGTLAALGAYGAASTFATASTGTAIAALSGAAATDATLAFLGGGALAVGGGGITLGSVALGGAVAGPALTILGIAMNAAASKNLDNAYINKWKAEELAEGFYIVTTLCNGIASRSLLFTVLLKKLDTLLSNFTVKLKNIIENSGNDYNQYSEYEQKQVAMALSVAEATKKVVTTPILNKDGSLFNESTSTCEEIKKLLNSIDSGSCDDLPGEDIETVETINYYDLLKEKIIEIFGDKNWSQYKEESYCKNVTSTVCRNEVKTEKILYFCDMTISSSGLKGLALTDQGIFCNYDDDLHVNYSDITQVKLHIKEGFFDANVLYIFTPDGKMHRHTWVDPFKLKKFLDYAISLYE